MKCEDLSAGKRKGARDGFAFRYVFRIDGSMLRIVCMHCSCGISRVAVAVHPVKAVCEFPASHMPIIIVCGIEGVVRIRKAII